MKYIVSFSETENGFQPLLSDGKSQVVYTTQEEAVNRYQKELAECKFEKLAMLDFDPVDEEAIGNATFLSVVDFSDPKNLKPVEVSDYFWVKK